jgi:hypothetical protein
MSQDAIARRAAKKVGLIATKSRTRKLSSDNVGAFMLIDPEIHAVVLGDRYDASAQGVIDYCRQMRPNET